MENFEVVTEWRCGNVGIVRRSLCHHPVPGPEFEPLLSIDCEGRGVDCMAEHGAHFDLAVVGKHDRTLVERMSTDRVEHDRFDVRHQDRSRCRKRVSRRAGRGRNDQAVAVIRGDLRAVRERFEVDQATNRRARDHDVVEREILRHFIIFAEHTHVKAHAGFNGKLTSRDAVETIFKFVAIDFSEKPEPAEVDPQNGHVSAANRPCRTEQRSVAANGNNEIDLGVKLLGFDNGEIGTARNRLVEHDFDLAFLSPDNDTPDDFFAIRLVRFETNANGFDLQGGPHCDVE